MRGWLEQAHAGRTPTWVVRRDGEVVGLVEAEIKKGAIASVGYFIDHAQQGQGLCTEALGAVVSWLLEQPDIHRVEAAVTADNVPSARVLEKLDFVHEGTSRLTWRWKGQWKDSLHYAKLSDDRLDS